MHQLDRALGIVLLLRTGRPQSARSLARHFEVSTRTIYRDVETLSALGVPIYAQRGRGGGLRLLEGYFLPPVTFTQNEALALVVGLALLRSLRAKPFATELVTAEAKLVATVPEAIRRVLADLERHIGFELLHDDVFHPEPVQPDAPAEAATLQVSADALSREEQVVTTFVQAIVNRKALTLRYRSPYRDEAEEVTVEPLGTFWDRGFWYLVGEAPGSAGAPRLWRADRVQRARHAAAPAEVPGDGARDFDVRTYRERRWLAAAMQRWADEAPVLVRLTPSLAERLRRDWYYRHARVEMLPDGDVVMTFGETDPEAVFDLVRWLGPGAELIEPIAWRDRFEVQLADMLGSYRTTAPSILTTS